MNSSSAPQSRPLSPNIQIYRPQLTSVLSIANRITGVVLSVGAVGLVVWLSAAAAGPKPYAAVQGVIGSCARPNRAVRLQLRLLPASVRRHPSSRLGHRAWLQLRSIYISGWAVVAASVALTVAAWVASLFIGGWR